MEMMVVFLTEQPLSPEIRTLAVSVPPALKTWLMVPVFVVTGAVLSPKFQVKLVGVCVNPKVEVEKLAVTGGLQAELS